MTPQYDASAASLLVLSSKAVGERARDALRSAAEALGHKTGPAFISTEAIAPEDLTLQVHTVDPWSVVLIDEGSLETLRKAFPDELQALTSDSPAMARGYQFVYVPDFEGCLDDISKKRIAWNRLKAAQHPGSPL